MFCLFCDFSVSKFEQTQNFKIFECANSKLLGNWHCEMCVQIKQSLFNCCSKVDIPFDIPLLIVLEDSFPVLK